MTTMLLSTTPKQESKFWTSLISIPFFSFSKASSPRIENAEATDVKWREFRMG